MTSGHEPPLAADDERMLATLHELEVAQARLLQAQAYARLGSWWRVAGSSQLDVCASLASVLGLEPVAQRIELESLLASVSDVHRDNLRKLLDAPGDATVPQMVTVRHPGLDAWIQWSLTAVSLTAPSPTTLSFTTRSLTAAAAVQQDTKSAPEGIAQDVSERVRAEQALSLQDARFRLLWHATPDAVVMVDDAALITFANPALRNVFGYAPEEVIGRHFSILQPVAAGAALQDALKRYLQTGVRTQDWRSAIAVGKHKDGSEFPVEISFSDMQLEGERTLAASIRNISARVRQQAALEESEQRFRSLTALSADWYWEQDENYRFKYVTGGNGQASVDLQVFVGKTTMEASNERQDERAWTMLKDAVAHFRPYRDMEFRHRADDGSLLILSLSGEPTYDAMGRFRGYRGVTRDITSQRRADEERRVLEGQLREAHKLEAMGVLAGGIAHDFNNVLAGILANAALAEDDLGRSHPVAHGIAEIRKAAVRGRALVRQILAFARQQPQQVEVLDLVALVGETVNLLRSTTPVHVALQMRPSETPILVRADPSQCGRVVMNLITNAWYAIGNSPGSIDVSVDTVHFPTDVRFASGALPAGSFARIRVADTGHGIEAPVLSRIFEPFFTTKREGEGTGLGLAVVHGVVAAHGGAIDVRSEVGKGTRFFVYLPLHLGTKRVTTHVDEPASAAQAAQEGAGERVMYVDDDEVMVLVVERMLSRLHYRVETFTDPAEAVRQFERRADDFDVVVTDFMMPGMTGFDLAQAVRAVSPGIPIIISSGNLPESTRAQARELGVNGLMRKENSLEELGGVIQRVLAGGSNLSMWAPLGGPE